MIIMRFKGGLGNQMFQYALYYKLKKLGKEVKADLSYYSQQNNSMPFVLGDVFPDILLEYVTKEEILYYTRMKNEQNILERSVAKAFWGKKYYTSEKEDGVFEKRVFGVKKGFLDGYWQSEKYFSDVRNELLNLYQFCKKDYQLMEFVKTMGSESVSVHIRRGDYLEHSEMYGGICNMDYYDKAMHYFDNVLNNPVYYVFSDDIEWAKRKFRDRNYVFVEKEIFQTYADWYDMFLMSQCHHNILANSSFSWWGAWLNVNEGKIVIAPKKWINGKDTKDIWCANWIKL